MKSVTRICMALIVLMLSTSMVFAQSNNLGKNAISQEELSLMKEHEGLTVHPNYAGPSDQLGPAITSFPFTTGFESGIPPELDAQPGTYADVRQDDNAAYTDTYGMLFEGYSSTGWGATPTTYSAAFDPSKSTHFGTVYINVVPDGTSGTLKMTYWMRQGYSFSTNYNWFRVLVEGNLTGDEGGGPGYYQAVSPVSYMGQWVEYTFDLSAYDGAPFQIILQSSCKYYELYYQQGDVVHIDDFKIWYMVPPGDVEGYVFNGDGLSIAGATIGVEGGAMTTSSPSGYYFLPTVDGGNQPMYAIKGWIQHDYGYCICHTIWDWYKKIGY